MVSHQFRLQPLRVFKLPLRISQIPGPTSGGLVSHPPHLGYSTSGFLRNELHFRIKEDMQEIIVDIKIRQINRRMVPDLREIIDDSTTRKRKHRYVALKKFDELFLAFMEEEKQETLKESQGLSLSLSSQILIHSFKYQSAGSTISVLSSYHSSQGNFDTYSNDESTIRFPNVCIWSYRGTDIRNTIIPNSKYLKTAQQLLDEMVNVQKVLKRSHDNQSGNISSKPTCKDNVVESKSGANRLNHLESATNSSSELSPSERQELQNTMTNLLAMLDEVDRRYKQYYHQMQIVASFDTISDFGVAKLYISLAL
ncbi:BEL1-like homeodomain protein 7 [Platanthera guangdongensis]|uniref:BEL1-like homeodomain protein 7 n=1 Tax=Platanthera guangdongensis TaxID=2320717 RepID=A0ABR2M537_9ASPA